MISKIGNGDMDIISAWLVTILYTFQLYYDFSGYSDIAIGLARFMGYKFNENFNFPYISTSISEFWRRWHISLGEWLKKYIYIPLGGNRKGEIKTLLNLFCIMVISGIWHGTGVGYIVWGAIHGIFIVIERICSNKKWYIEIPNIIKWSFTMFVVSICWIIFMTGTLEDTISHIEKMVGIGNGNPVFTYQYYITKKLIFLLGISFVGAIPFKMLRKKIEGMDIFATNVYFVISRIFLISMFIIDLICITNSTYSPFIYFQY